MNDLKSIIVNGIKKKNRNKQILHETKISLSQLEKFLDRAANILRGGVDASEYKEFIFGMMFIKRLSDQFDQHKAEIIEKYSKMGLDADTSKSFFDSTFAVV